MEIQCNTNYISINYTYLGTSKQLVYVSNGSWSICNLHFGCIPISSIDYQKQLHFTQRGTECYRQSDSSIIFQLLLPTNRIVPHVLEKYLVGIDPSSAFITAIYIELILRYNI